MPVYPREKFNAALGHIAHMTVVMCHYLGVSLPFQIVYGGSKSHISPGFFDAKASKQANRSLMPLYLDSNLDIFTVGLVMLNYDILYLCWTQGVLIPLHQAANTLENLAACCRASKLG
ncbi:UV radiation resistance protein/autophagy-related protein 14, partial [Chytriomyces sp. MP71]